MKAYDASDDGLVHEIVGESGTQTGEGCLQEVAVGVAAMLALALLFGAALVAFG